MGAPVRRRRWPLFFEPRRRFKKKVLKVVRMFRAALRYLARTSAAAAKGRTARAELQYRASPSARTAATPGWSLPLLYLYMRWLTVSKAKAAAQMWARMYSLVKIWSRDRPAPRLSYWSWFGRVGAAERGRLALRLYYRAYSPSAWASWRALRMPELWYWGGGAYVEVEKRRREEEGQEEA